MLGLEQFLSQKRFIQKEVQSRFEQTKVASSQAAKLLEKMREVYSLVMQNLGELEERKNQKLSQYE
jgi:hypothetical protein